jgi:bifunctional DNA-binding transcriptional regulator/antitoxin component of YhaV-PrlF toxin-antitoxin module
MPTEGVEMAFIVVDQRGRATFPQEVRRELGLDAGDSSFVILEKTERGTYELIPAALIPRDQLWFYSEEVQTGIAAAEADFRSGRSVATSSAAEAQAHLDRLKRR